MPETDEDLLKEIRQKYDYFCEAWKDQREAANKDTMLMANRPFTDKEIKDRGNQPTYLVDGLGQYANQITNNIRQNPRGVNVHPKNSRTDRKKAEQVANWARGIEKDSDAQAVYCTAFEGAAIYGGMGFMRLEQQYESRMSDRQVFRLARVPSHQSILPSPDCKKIDFSDMEECFVLDSRKYDAFLAENPKAKVRDFDKYKSKWYKFGQTDYSKWIREGDLQIAEYWKVKKTKDTLLVMDTSTIRLSKLPPGTAFQPTKDDPKGGGLLMQPGRPDVPVRSSREEMYPSVWQYVTNGVEIIDRQLWDEDDDSIPIYPIVGREMYVDDGSGPKRQYVSAIRFTVHERGSTDGARKPAPGLSAGSTERPRHVPGERRQSARLEQRQDGRGA